MPTRSGLPLCLASIDLAAPSKNAARFPPRTGQKNPRQNIRDFSTKSVSHNGGKSNKEMGKSGRKRDSKPPIKAGPDLNRLKTDSNRGLPAGIGGSVAVENCGTQKQLEEGDVHGVRAEISVQNLSFDAFSGDESSLRTPSAVLEETVFSSQRVEVSESDDLSSDVEDVRGTEGEGDTEGEEEDDDLEFGSPVARHRLALTLEMAELDRLRSALREREQEQSRRESEHGTASFQNADQQQGLGGVSMAPLRRNPSDPQLLAPQHTERALDIIKAGLASTAPRKWGASWQGWGARAA